jgi:hypothetical protein
MAALRRRAWTYMVAAVSRQFLVATFPDEVALRRAARRLRDRGFRIHDVYTPYPVHGMDELMGLKPSRLPIATLVGGVVGCATALAMQFYMAVFDWPLNVGGKPPNSTLAFLPVAFELTVLFAGLLTAAAFLTRSRLAPGVRAAHVADGTTEDVFALMLRRRNAAFDADEARRLLVSSGAAHVALREVPR